MNDAPDILAWLRTKPDLASMRSRYPEEWRRVEKELAGALTERSTAKLDAILVRSEAGGGSLPTGRKRRRDAALRLMRQRMAILAIQRVGTDAAVSNDVKTMRLGRLTRAITSALFRDEAGDKKPIAIRVFRMVWPLVPGKGAFLTREQAHGTYCFLSREFVEAVALIVDGRRCLEIAAGDGTLTRFLAEMGVHAVAIDDMSWGHEIRYPDLVQRMGARQALRTYKPEVVLCSWPPPGNSFEAAVFTAPSVDTYIVVGSRHAFATGAREAYQSAPGFSCEVAVGLSRLILPPEAGHEVLVFRRLRDDRRQSRLAPDDTVP